MNLYYLKYDKNLHSKKTEANHFIGSGRNLNYRPQLNKIDQSTVNELSDDDLRLI